MTKKQPTKTAPKTPPPGLTKPQLAAALRPLEDRIDELIMRLEERGVIGPADPQQG